MTKPSPSSSPASYPTSTEALGVGLANTPAEKWIAALRLCEAAGRAADGCCHDCTVRLARNALAALGLVP